VRINFPISAVRHAGAGVTVLSRDSTPEYLRLSIYSGFTLLVLSGLKSCRRCTIPQRKSPRMNNQVQSGLESRVLLFASRFALVYFVLYNLPFPIGALPRTQFFLEKYQGFWHSVVPLFAKNILHLNHKITSFSNGSSDTTYDYVLVLFFLLLALAAALLWTFFGRWRLESANLHQWLRVYVRFAVSAAMFNYGAAKIFQQQFGPPDLYKLLEPHGESSPMGLLWTFMGVSRGYCILTGSVEILSGLLLLIPRCSTLGALLGIIAMANVFALNVFYDVPVKLYSLHLLLMCIFLVLPQTRRFLNFFVLNRNAEPSTEPALFKQRRFSMAALAVQLLLGLFLLGSYLYQSYAFEIENVSAASHPPFYGIWVVDEFSLAGKALQPVLTDDKRWNRVVIRFPKGIGIQSMDGTWTGYWLLRDMEKKTFAMQKPGDPKPKFQFNFSSPDSSSLILDGSDGATPIHMKLHRLDEHKFALLSSGFRWVHEDADY
jgi:hypothetical protein